MNIRDSLRSAFGLEEVDETDIEEFYDLIIEYHYLDYDQLANTLGRCMLYLTACETALEAVTLWHPCFDAVIATLSAGGDREHGPGYGVEKIRLRDLNSKFQSFTTAQRKAIAAWLQWVTDEFPVTTVDEIQAARSWWAKFAEQPPTGRLDSG